ncbi:hypothetical protein N8I74_16415 [Chitiniphilus purpureus]|uniref:N-methyl-D-aspartate receptor NMDAR2C subunit n=1 Tax=Chitiniphilus purpureus TaxID=2981137 RepID=A0ABY6DLG8_9NEIS|nr:hypothetical protein [Chitiniphilus sp. CD1]UXY14882.1 hypothetical protein N8I74_16415 [Chitiniphilus sp. CD1]
MTQLLAAYQAPQRQYHTLQHLSECLALLSRHAALAEQPAEVEMALWFHDAVYAATAGDNEACSSAWVASSLGLAGAAPARIERISRLVLATRHTLLPQGRDAQLLVDIDLAILGAPPARFEQYEAQVRAEYGWVPGSLFRRGRRAILAHFLARDPLYHTPHLQAAFAAQARKNLIHALQRLAAGPGC